MLNNNGNISPLQRAYIIASSKLNRTSEKVARYRQQQGAKCVNDARYIYLRNKERINRVRVNELVEILYGDWQ